MGLTEIISIRKPEALRKIGEELRALGMLDMQTTLSSSCRRLARCCPEPSGGAGLTAVSALEWDRKHYGPVAARHEKAPVPPAPGPAARAALAAAPMSDVMYPR